MKSIYFLFIFCILSFSIAESQVLKGRVIEKKTKQAVVYANIGVLGKNIGCVTNNFGVFQLHLEGITTKDTIRCSMIGYKAQSFTLTHIDISKELIIYFEDDTLKLSEVVISGKAFNRTKTVGVKSESRKIVTGWGFYGIGGERGLKININNPPAIIKDINVHIAYNGFDSVLFRLHIYNIKDKLPYQNILNKNIFIKAERTGWVNKDLSPYNIVLEEDVIITIEWVKAWGECKKPHYCMYISASFLKGVIIAKEASESQWQRKIGSPSIYVTVKD